MQYREYGSERQKTLILLHGGGLSWWNYREQAQLLEKDFRVILPILDGHALSDRPFTSIEENAAEIISFIDEHCGGAVDLLGGLSLGAQIAVEMLSQREKLCRCALIESAMLIPSKLTHSLVAPALSGSYGLIRNRSFARTQFRSLHIKEELFEDYYRDSCRIGKSDMIAFLQANALYALKPSIARCGAKLHVYAAGKEPRGVLRSAELLRGTVDGCDLTVLPGLYHGEFSLNHADEYARAVRELLKS